MKFDWKNSKYEFMLLLVAAIWGAGFIAGKEALSQLTPVTVLFYRFSAAAAVTGIFWRKHIFCADRKNIFYGAVLGLFQFSGLYIQLFALQYTSTAKQSFLAATYVVIVPFVSWFIIKSRPKIKDYVSSVVAIAGIGLISLTKVESVNIGDLITLVFAVVFSVQIVITGIFAKKGEAVSFTFYQFLTSAVLASACLLIKGESLVVPHSSSFAAVFYLAVINTAVAMCLQNIAQKHVKENRSALIFSLESVFGLIFSILIYNEKISAQMLAGCVLVFASLMLSMSDVGVKAKNTKAEMPKQRKECRL